MWHEGPPRHGPRVRAGRFAAEDSGIRIEAEKAVWFFIPVGGARRDNCAACGYLFTKDNQTCPLCGRTERVVGIGVVVTVVLLLAIAVVSTVLWLAR